MSLTDRIREICIPKTATLLQTMEAIQRGAIEIAMVVNENYKLLGTVTDGDIRRAILSGADINDSIARYMKKEFFSVHPKTSRAEVLDIMKAWAIRQIPVLNKKGQLIGLHLLQEMLGATPRDNWAVIMAGGRGERLRPLTDSLPKPMLRIAGRPILERILLHLVGFGIRKIFMAVHYKREIIENHFGDGKTFGCEISYLREEKPLGTGGALSLLPKYPTLPLIVINGDIVTQFDLESLFEFHRKGKFYFTVAVHEYLHTIPYGVIEVDRTGRVKNMMEKPSYSWKVNTGIYVIEPELLNIIPSKTFFTMPALIDSSLEMGKPVGVFHIIDDWQDVGRHEELKKACGRN